MSEANALSDTATKIVNQPYCDPTKRMDFVLVYDVRDGNPNGDPDAGNLPRMDPMTRHGIVTDVCIKRKIRDQLLASKRPIYIQSSTALNTLYYRAAGELAEEKKITISPVEVVVDRDSLMALLPELAKLSEEQQEEHLSKITAWLVGLDVEGFEYRPDETPVKLAYFGELKNANDLKAALSPDSQLDPKLAEVASALGKKLADVKKGKKGSGAAKLTQEDKDVVKDGMCARYDDIRLFGAVLTAGTNAGQVLGPMQLTFGRSVEPILQMDTAITRCAITKASDRERKQTEFGRKPWLPWAVYRQHGFFNAPLAAKTKVTKEDLARFWEAVAGMFSTPSASKGLMALRDLVVFVHDCPRGNAPSHLLFDKVTVQKRSAVDGELAIKREGFEDEYAVAVTEPSEACGVKCYRPLKDIWPVV